MAAQRQCLWWYVNAYILLYKIMMAWKPANQEDRKTISEDLNTKLLDSETSITWETYEPNASYIHGWYG